MYQNEILQETCNCYLLLEYHQLKADCIDSGVSGKITYNCIFSNTFCSWFATFDVIKNLSNFNIQLLVSNSHEWQRQDTICHFSATLGSRE